MTKHDYMKAAVWLRDARPEGNLTAQCMRWKTLVCMMTCLFADTNPQFDKYKFYEACGYKWENDPT